MTRRGQRALVAACHAREARDRVVALVVELVAWRWPVDAAIRHALLRHGLPPDLAPSIERAWRRPA